MAETGDWVTPRLYGQPWFEKPILYYWAAALGFLLHLPAEWAARLPSAFAALAAALRSAGSAGSTTADDARSRSSPALLAPLIFSTSVAAIGFARAATPGHAIQRRAYAGDGQRGARVRRRGHCAAELLRDESTAQSDDYATCSCFSARSSAWQCWPRALRRSSWPAGRSRSGRWRRGSGARHSVCASLRDCRFLRCRASLVRALRAAQSRLSARLHSSAQFRALPDSVFQHRQPFWFFGPIILLALLPWTVFLWPWRRKVCASGARNRGRIRPDFSSPAGRFSRFVLQLFAVEAARLHSPGSSATDCSASLSIARTHRSRAVRTRSGTRWRLD